MSDITATGKQVLSINEALLFKDTVINKWRPQSDVWAFKYGDGILGSLTALGGVVITHIFRKNMKLLPYARLTCYMPVVGIASLSSFMIQDILINSQIIKANKCPLCITTRATIFQVFFGVGYTLFAASTVCFYMADRLLTYPVPPLVKAPREVFHLFKKIVLKNPRPYLIIGAIHMIAASFITFQKQETLIRLDLQTRRY